MASNDRKPPTVKGGKGNWYVHQRGAAPVAYPSKQRAQNAAKSLRNAKVTSKYQSAGAYGGKHSVSDSKPGGCAVFALLMVGSVVAGLGAVGTAVAVLVG